MARLRGVYEGSGQASSGILVEPPERSLTAEGADSDV